MISRNTFHTAATTTGKKSKVTFLDFDKKKFERTRDILMTPDTCKYTAPDFLARLTADSMNKTFDQRTETVKSRVNNKDISKFFTPRK